jgi:PKD repeat protein
MKPFRSHHRLHRSLMAAVLAVAAACSSKSPTEPSTPPVSPKVPPPVTTYAITVTANPNHLTVGSSTGSTITVQAVDVSTGLPAPDLTPVTLTTTLGEFNSIGSGLQTVTLQLVHGKAQAVLFPGTSAGTATLAATSPSGSGVIFNSGAASVIIGSVGTLFLSAVTPNTGDPAGGTPVTITGGGFIAPVAVTFGSSSATVKSVSPSAIQVITPPSSVPVAVGSTLQVNITVNNNVGGTQANSATLANAFTYVPGGGGIQQPLIFSVTPASGTNDGGTRIVIVGQGFVAPVQVFFGSGATPSTFNGVEATVQSTSATQLVVVSPPARGFGQDNTNVLVSILVKNLNSGFATIDPAAFKYGSRVIVTSAAPTKTLWNQPVKVIIFGQGFADPVAVGLAGFAATVLSTSGTEIQVLSPIPQLSGCTNITGVVHVTNINDNDSGDGPPWVFEVPHPAISGVTPNSGSGNGGDHVVVNGGFFEPVTFGDRVLFGGAAGSVDAGSSTPTQLAVTTPPFSGTFPTQPCFVGGVAGTMNIPIAVDVQVINVASGCSDTLPKGFTYIPADQSCHITPPPPPPAPKASFTSTTSTGSFTVIFNDTSTGPPTSWSWNFGDPTSGANNTSAAQNPVHTFTGGAGTYVVTLTVSNASGTSTVSNFVKVPGT